jgi:hypothetical protein
MMECQFSIPDPLQFKPDAHKYMQINIHFYHILGSVYAGFARRDIDDVIITHISTPCKKCISISARVHKMHINISTRAKNAYQ